MPILRKKLNQTLTDRNNIILKGHEHHQRAIDYGLTTHAPLPRNIRHAFARKEGAAVLAAKHEWAKLPGANDAVHEEVQLRKKPVAAFKRKVVATSDALDRREARRQKRSITGDKNKHSFWNDLSRIWGAGRK